MAIVLKRFSALGPGRKPAEAFFGEARTLIRGPSETGKSHIYDCLWYMLGGSSSPETFPQLEGYDQLELIFQHEGHEYVIRRAMSGGGAAIFVRLKGAQALEPVNEDLGELLVRLSGAEGMLVLRNLSKKGPVTGDDLRHWALLSQPGIISKNPTSGPNGPSAPKRRSSFSLFLTGQDDSAVEVKKSTAEVERLNGQLASATANLERIQAGIPTGIDRTETREALDRVDLQLSAVSSALDMRSGALKALRQRLGDANGELKAASNERTAALTMKERFQLLDRKYLSDMARLGATAEGISFYEVLPETPCPLCGTPVEQQVDPNDLKPRAPSKYQQAIAAELRKIQTLREGLQQSINYETSRAARASAVEALASDTLEGIQKEEQYELLMARLEFEGSPRELADSHTRLSSMLAIFDEEERLSAEIKRLKAAKVQPKVTVTRSVSESSGAVAGLAREMLSTWGFASIKSVHIDPAKCDLVIDGRDRLSYGAGTRALFLAAMTIALMAHALDEGFPHLGVVVVDSPLKAYADPTLRGSDGEVAVATVTDQFYAWLSEWSGPGQIVVLENEKVTAETAAVLDPIEFSGSHTEGRQGFYPPRSSV